MLDESENSAETYDKAARLSPGEVSIRVQQVRALLTGRAPADPVPPPVIALLHQVEATAPDQPLALWYLGLAAAQDAQLDDAAATGASCWRRCRQAVTTRRWSHRLSTRSANADRRQRAHPAAWLDGLIGWPGAARCACALGNHTPAAAARDNAPARANRIGISIAERPEIAIVPFGLLSRGRLLRRFRADLLYLTRFRPHHRPSARLDLATRTADVSQQTELRQ